MKGSLSPLFTWRSAVSSAAGPPPTQRHVALALSLHMSERGDSCFPAIETLVEEIGLARSTILNALRELERAGWLSRKSGGGRGRPTTYRALIPETVRETDCFPKLNRPADDEKQSGSRTLGRQEGAKEKPTATTSRRRSSSNSIVWDSFVEIFGEVHGRAESKARGTAVADVQRCLQAEKITEEDWPAEIRQRAARYRRDWPTVALTDHALARHFSKFGVNGASGPKPPSVEERVRTWTRSTGYRFVDAGEAAAIIAEIAGLREDTDETTRRLKQLVEIWKEERVAVLERLDREERAGVKGMDDVREGT